MSQSTDEARIAERRRLVMIARRQGKSISEIHEWWNYTYPAQMCSRATIGRDVQESLAETIAQTRLDTNQWRMLHIERIEKVMSTTAFQNRLTSGDPKAIQAFVRLSDQLIKLTGSYMPVEVKVDDAGKKLPMTEEERLGLMEQMLNKIRARKQAREEQDKPFAEVVRPQYLLTDSQT